MAPRDASAIADLRKEFDYLKCHFGRTFKAPFVTFKAFARPSAPEHLEGMALGSSEKAALGGRAGAGQRARGWPVDQPALCDLRAGCRGLTELLFGARL